MSSTECILADLRMSEGIISVVSSPRNVPNNATLSTGFLVTVPFFFFLTMSLFFRIVSQIWFGFKPIRIKEEYFEK